MNNRFEIDDWVIVTDGEHKGCRGQVTIVTLSLRGSPSYIINTGEEFIGVWDHQLISKNELVKRRLQ